MKKTGLTYEELIALAHVHYDRGGDATVECWGPEDYKIYCEMFGPMTRKAALGMFAADYEREKAAEAGDLW